MTRDWRIIGLSGAVTIVALVGLFSWFDRNSVTEALRAVTQTNARMIAAHGEVALGEAAQVAAAILPAVEAWDLRDPNEGQSIHERLYDLVNASPRIRSAWVVNADGMTQVDSWTWPSQTIDATGRDYFRRHAAGELGPVVSRQEVGVISGTARFTYSVPILDDGALHAVIVVGLLASDFDALYAEALASPGSMVGLFSRQGDVLAEYSVTDDIQLSEMLDELTIFAAVAPAGVESARYFGGQKVIAWHTMNNFPSVFAVRAASLEPALAQWRLRTLYLAFFGLAVALLFALLARSVARTNQERETVLRAEITTREVYHRMKNSLQMISSVVRLRARKSDQPEVRAELDQVAAQLRALAEVQNLLQVSDRTGEVDLGDVLVRLCDRIEASHAQDIRFAAGGKVPIDAGDAARVAILANELITNAMKHGDGRIEVKLDSNTDHAELSIANGGSGLPEGFDLARQESFGLRTVHAVAESLGATVEAGNGGTLGGAMVRVRIPHAPPAGEEAGG
jgi:two-component sensor histidine kinase